MIDSMFSLCVFWNLNVKGKTSTSLRGIEALNRKNDRKTAHSILCMLTYLIFKVTQGGW